MAMKTSPSRAKLTGFWSGVRQDQWRAGDALERIEVPPARRVHHSGREPRRRRLAVPSPRAAFAVEVVAQRLLVEARLRPSGCVALGGPETRAVGSQHFIDEPDRARGVAAELELRVGDDDPAGCGEIPPARVDEPAHRLERVRDVGTEA